LSQQGDIAVVIGDQAMREFGTKLASQLRAGDLILLKGGLGAGKTTLAQGIAKYFGIQALTSPTFVMAKIYPLTQVASSLIHVDAYRLVGDALALFDDLDLESALPRAITIIEWGEGFIDRLGSEYLTLELRYLDVAGQDAREIICQRRGARWQEISL
jgi:tRNA threonylcarbamoyladenosine biosynthesis protein TsaE